MMSRARVTFDADQVKGFILTPRLDLPVDVRFIWISSVEVIITSGIQWSIFFHMDQPITIASQKVYAWNRETRYFKSCFPLVCLQAPSLAGHSPTNRASCTIHFGCIALLVVLWLLCLSPFSWGVEWCGEWSGVGSGVVWGVVWGGGVVSGEGSGLGRGVVWGVEWSGSGGGGGGALSYSW